MFQSLSLDHDTKLSMQTERVVWSNRNAGAVYEGVEGIDV